MSTPRQPKLPEKGTVTPAPDHPNPLHRPDERKEGGPDFGKEERQRDKRRRNRDDAREEAEPKPDRSE